MNGPTTKWQTETEGWGRVTLSGSVLMVTVTGDRAERLVTAVGKQVGAVLGGAGFTGTPGLT